MKIFIAISAFCYSFLFINTVQGEEAVKPGFVVAFESGKSVRVILPPNCKIEASAKYSEISYFIIYRNSKGFGSNFEMILSVQLDKSDPLENPVISIILFGSDFYDIKTRRWVEDVKAIDGKIHFLLAQYDREKLPADVSRSWLTLAAIEKLLNK